MRPGFWRSSWQQTVWQKGIDVFLASPLIPDVTARLNAAVKFREPFRPFAPVILAEHAPGYFRLGQPSPFMAIAVPATDLAREKVPAVVHANGTARVQTLARADNPFLAGVLDRFTELILRSTSRASRSAAPRRWPSTAWPPAGWTG